MVIVIDRETTSFLYPRHSWPRFEHHVVFLGQCKEIWPKHLVQKNLNNQGSEVAGEKNEAEKRHQKWIEGWKKTTDARGSPQRKEKKAMAAMERKTIHCTDIKMYTSFSNI